MRRAFAHVINHGLAGLLRVAPWRYVKVGVRVVPWRIVALVALALCVVAPLVLGRRQPFRGSLAEAEAMSILYIGRRVGAVGVGAVGGGRVLGPPGQPWQGLNPGRPAPFSRAPARSIRIGHRQLRIPPPWSNEIRSKWLATGSRFATNIGISKPRATVDENRNPAGVGVPRTNGFT